MNTTEIVAKLTGSGMQNSYLMTYMASVREELDKLGFKLTPEVMAQLGKFTDNATPPDPASAENYEEVAAIAAKVKDPAFEASLKNTYKVKMLEVLAALEIELTPEAIAAFKAEMDKNPIPFAPMFASVL
ncbi:MAG: hypothetical protein VKJ02_17555 [Snowella sp.]|nr:hypothetical protein [Snowella sp.]